MSEEEAKAKDPEEQQARLRAMPMGELQMRRQVANGLLGKLLEHGEWREDPRYEGAVAEYRHQVEVLDAEITRRVIEERRAQGLPDPEPIVVGLKTAVLFPKSEKGACG